MSALEVYIKQYQQKRVKLSYNLFRKAEHTNIISKLWNIIEMNSWTKQEVYFVYVTGCLQKVIEFKHSLGSIF